MGALVIFRHCSSKWPHPPSTELWDFHHEQQAEIPGLSDRAQSCKTDGSYAPTKGGDIATDLQGAGQMAVDAVVGITNLVEDAYRNISSLSSLVGIEPKGRARGIAGLVYGQVRGVTRLVRAGLDALLPQLSPFLGESEGSARRESILAAINGVYGDHLEATGNPLAIPMQFRQQGRAFTLEPKALTQRFANGADKLLVMVHGACSSDLMWLVDGHDHGAALAADLGYTTVYLNYNSGRHISDNGREFALQLEQLLAQWSAPWREVIVIGHSMGGLVTRSAFQWAGQHSLTWPQRVNKFITLGTPHHGAPLELAGSWLDALLSANPYTAPYALLTKGRSVGIKDLRHGSLIDTDWADPHRAHASDPRQPAALPPGVACYTLAASLQTQPDGPRKRLRSDGLVSVKSALGQHEDPAMRLNFPPAHQRICFGVGHIGMLGSQEVYRQLKDWCGN